MTILEEGSKSPAAYSGLPVTDDNEQNTTERSTPAYPASIRTMKKEGVNSGSNPPRPRYLKRLLIVSSVFLACGLLFLCPFSPLRWCWTPTKAPGGGRDWVLNKEDGTISAKHAPDLVLGAGNAPIVLVKRGDARQFVFETINTLEKGEMVPLTLKNEDGEDNDAPAAAIGVKHPLNYYSPGDGMKWAYYKTFQVSDPEDAVVVKYEDNRYISLVNADMVLDIAFWKYEEGNTVSFVGGANDDSPTKLEGGGRDFVLNIEDGTIASKVDPSLVLGRGISPLVLVERGDPKQLIFSDIDLLATGEIISASLTSPPGMVIGKKYKGEKLAGPWRYIEGSLSEDSSASVKIQYVDENYIMLVDGDLAFDVAYWKLYEGNTVNFVGGTC